MMRRTVLSAVALLVLLCVDAHSIHRGRKKFGMLRDPVTSLNHYNEPQIRWLTQKLDHFNPANRQTWQQRYMVNSQFHKEGGPVFLMLGGEGPASPKWLSARTHIMILAEKFNALVFQLEHRYYGESHPTADLSTQNLAYLTSHQALADAAYFRNVMTKRRNLPQDSKWVVFGGSYSGSLAAWFKLKYPHLAIGAVASSAPMVALIDFVDYVRVVRDSLGSTCSSKVAEGFEKLQALSTSRKQWPIIDKKFKTCDPFDAYNKLNLQNFFQSVAGNFEGVVQYNEDERISGRSNVTIDLLCKAMMQEEDAVDGLAAVNSIILQDGKQDCLDYDYSKFVHGMRNVSLAAEFAEGGRQWTYQTCVEFGFFQSSDAEDQPFGNLFPVQLFIQQCRDIFDDYFDENLLTDAVFRTNTEYGATSPQLRNVTFPNGSIDPWHALGVLEDLSEDVTANFIKGTAHCADMYPPSSSDLESLTQARQKIESEIAKWLA